MFESVDTLSDCIKIATGVISTIRVFPERMQSALSADMLATDLAEYLVRKGTFITLASLLLSSSMIGSHWCYHTGVPFRETHHLSGAAVKLAEEKGCELSDLAPEDLKSIHPLFEADVTGVWDFDASAERRDTEGGTSRRSVLEQAKKLTDYISQTRASSEEANSLQ